MQHMEAIFHHKHAFVPIEGLFLQDLAHAIDTGLTHIFIFVVLEFFFMVEGCC